MKKFAFVLGTSAELIKVYPVLLKMSERGLPWVLVASGQSHELLQRDYKELGLPLDRLHVVVFETGLTSSLGALKWFVKALFRACSRSFWKQIGVDVDSKNVEFVVHGDTITTLLGSLVAKRWRRPVHHIEAGMRSKSLWSPFPEEITRRLVTRFATLHFASSDECVSNLRAEGVGPERIVHTGVNTAQEACKLLMSHPRPTGFPDVYAIANIHRFENLNSPPRWKLIVETLNKAAKQLPVIFIAHPQTLSLLRSKDSAPGVSLDSRIRIVERMKFIEFIPLLSHAEFLLGDSGGNQDDCVITGTPYLVLRDHTESSSGIDPRGPVVLSQMNSGLVEKFLSSYKSFKTKDSLSSTPSPSAVICSKLENFIKIQEPRGSDL